MNWDNQSNFVGYIGERLRNIPVILEQKNSFFNPTTNSNTYFYQFKKDNDRLIWWTSVRIPHQINTPIVISGTVKDHITYKGEDKTVLTRVKVEER